MPESMPTIPPKKISPEVIIDDAVPKQGDMVMRSFTRRVFNKYSQKYEDRFSFREYYLVVGSVQKKNKIFPVKKLGEEQAHSIAYEYFSTLGEDTLSMPLGSYPNPEKEVESITIKKNGL